MENRLHCTTGIRTLIPCTSILNMYVAPLPYCWYTNVLTLLRAHFYASYKAVSLNTNELKATHLFSHVI